VTTEQWLGLFFLAIGIYFIVCSGWKRDFFLYRIKIRTTAALFGETFTHGFFFLFGVGFAVCGILKALGIWGPPGPVSYPKAF
jgi:hypothetical protein